MKVIYDFGANNGDDLPYYFLKSDRVVAIEANPELCDGMRSRFKAEILSGRLVVENCVATAGITSESVTFYLSRHNHVLSQFGKPTNEADFFPINVRAVSASEIVKAHGDPFYIKIDVEKYDQHILRHLFENGIRPNYLSAECHDVEVFALLLALGKYESFKLTLGDTVCEVYKNHEVRALDGAIRKVSFPFHSAGPFGQDLKGEWMTPNNFLKLLTFEELGWRDIHVSNIDSPNLSAVVETTPQLYHSGRPITVGGKAVQLIDLPLVSFILVNWNYAEYVGQTIDSIIAQHYQRFECIIVDNGSDDESREVIARHVGNDPRFKTVLLPSNLGQLGGVFIGLKEARAPFVVVVDSDDVLFANFASSHLQAHLAAPENVSITTSNIIEVDREGCSLSSQFSPSSKSRSQGKAGFRPKEAVARLSAISDQDYENLSAMSRTLPGHIGGWLWSPGTSNMIRASALRPFLRSDGAQYMRSADNYLLPLCHAMGGTAVIDVALSAYRIHDRNYHTVSESLHDVPSGNQNHRTQQIKDYLQNMEYFLSTPNLHLNNLGRLRFWKTIDQVGLGNFNHRNAAYYKLFLNHAQLLREATGNGDFIRNILARFSFFQTLCIIFADKKGPRVKLVLKAFLLKARRRKLRRLRRETIDA